MCAAVQGEKTVPRRAGCQPSSSAGQVCASYATMQGPCGAAPLATRSKSVSLQVLYCCGASVRAISCVKGCMWSMQTYVCEHGPRRSAWSCCAAAAAVALLPCSVRVHACVRPRLVVSFVKLNSNAPAQALALRGEQKHPISGSAAARCWCVCFCCWNNCVSDLLMPESCSC